MPPSLPSSARDEGHGGSEGRRSSSSSGPSSRRNLVFLNFSNPSRDSKLTRHRKLVSKHAMLGRARPDQDEGESSAAAGDAASTSPPRQQFVNTSQDEAHASHKAETYRQEIVQASRNLPILAPSPSKGMPLSGPGKPVTHLAAKKPHLSIHRPWRAIVRKNGMGQVASPVTTLGAANSDPFATLAMGSNPRINRLIYAYVNAHVITNRWYRGIPGYAEQLMNARRTLWFPLTLESEAASKALVAYLDATPDRPFGSDEQNGRFLSDALAETNKALRDKDLATTDGTCFAVALLMLTAQRMRDTHAFQTHAHGLAAVTSMRQEAPISSKYSVSVFKCFESTKSPPSREQPASVLSPTVVERSSTTDHALHDRKEYSNQPQTSSPTIEPSLSSSSSSSSSVPSVRPVAGLPLWIPTSATTLTNNGFHDLVNAGFISPTLADFFQRAWVLHSLGENGVKWDRVALIGVAEHIWVDDWPPDLAVNFFEKACYAAIQICFHLVVKPAWHYCWPVEKMAGTVFEALTCVDVNELLQYCPDTLLWLVMCAGPFLKGQPAEWFAMLLRRILQMLRPPSFNDAMYVILRRYMWVANMSPAARQFWNGDERGRIEEVARVAQVG